MSAYPLREQYRRRPPGLVVAAQGAPSSPGPPPYAARPACPTCSPHKCPRSPAAPPSSSESRPRPPAPTTTTTESTVCMMSSSVCPTPAVSTMITSTPAASSTRIAPRCRHGQPARRPSRRHAAYEYTGVEEVIPHPHPIPQDRPAGERTRRVNDEHPHGQPQLAVLRRYRLRQRALARARRSRQPNAVRVSPPRRHPFHDAVCARVPLL